MGQRYGGLPLSPSEPLLDRKASDADSLSSTGSSEDILAASPPGACTPPRPSSAAAAYTAVLDRASQLLPAALSKRLASATAGAVVVAGRGPEPAPPVQVAVHPRRGPTVLISVTQDVTLEALQRAAGKATGGVAANFEFVVAGASGSGAGAPGRRHGDAVGFGFHPCALRRAHGRGCVFLGGAARQFRARWLVGCRGRVLRPPGLLASSISLPRACDCIPLAPNPHPNHACRAAEENGPPGFKELLRSTAGQLSHRQRAKWAVLDGVDWLFVPQSISAELRGSGLLAWLDRHVLANLREPGADAALPVAMHLATGRRTGMVLPRDAALARLRRDASQRAGILPERQQLTLRERRAHTPTEEAFWAAARLFLAYVLVRAWEFWVLWIRGGAG